MASSPRLPLLALRAFVEVGRAGSIKEAAQALSVTPGAVSQHVKLLETRLGVQLLERLNRQVRLTPEGLRLFEHAVRGFDLLDEAAQLFAPPASRRQSLVVSTTPSFAATWLATRLGRFTRQYSLISVRVETSAQLTNLVEGQVDIAIRHGAGQYRGVHVLPLFDARLVVVGSPSLLRQGPPVVDAKDCLRYPLLQDRDHADWPRWLEAQGVKVTRKALAGPSYADDALLLRAAAAGQGLAVVRDVYARDELALGHVALAHPSVAPTGKGYFAVCLSRRAKEHEIAAFLAWVAQEAQKTQAG